jgi:hypothetical protein
MQTDESSEATDTITPEELTYLRLAADQVQYDRGLEWPFFANAGDCCVITFRDAAVWQRIRAEYPELTYTSTLMEST